LVGSSHEVLEPVQRYFAALNAADSDVVQELFTEDGVVMQPGEATVSGRPAIMMFLEKHFAVIRFGRELHVDEVLSDGSLGTVRCHTTGTVTVQASGEVKRHESRELFVLRRADDGWRIRHYMFNYPAR
jgi:uncharacterized protein (TIGR02246 family)